MIPWATKQKKFLSSDVDGPNNNVDRSDRSRSRSVEKMDGYTKTDLSVIIFLRSSYTAHNNNQTHLDYVLIVETSTSNFIKKMLLLFRVVATTFSSYLTIKLLFPEMYLLFSGTVSPPNKTSLSFTKS